MSFNRDHEYGLEFIAQWYLNYTIYGNPGISWLYREFEFCWTYWIANSTRELFVLNLSEIDSETLCVRWGTELEVLTEITSASTDTRIWDIEWD